MKTIQEDRPIAPESEKTRKAREKLIKVWEEEKKQITPKAIRERVDKIHQWIADNAKDRVQIKEKTLKLFDGKENAVGVSKKIEKFTEELKENMKFFSTLREKG